MKRPTPWWLRLWRWVFDNPREPVRVPRPRRPCPRCGRVLAVVARTHEVWRHDCRPVPEHVDPVIDPRD